MTECKVPMPMFPVPVLAAPTEPRTEAVQPGDVARRAPHRKHRTARRRRKRYAQRPSIAELVAREFGPPQQADTMDDAPRMTSDERNMAMARVCSDIKQAWRACPARVCRRRHRCSWHDAARRVDCAGPPLTPEQLAAARADFYKMLDWRAGLSS